MLQGPLVFVDIDTQRDFLEPSGALYVPDSVAIVDNLARLTRFARSHDIPVLATACAHSPEDREFEDFPLHCLLGTSGQSRIDATAWPGGQILASDEGFVGSLPAHLTVEKKKYKVSSHPEAGRLLALYDRGHPTFVVYGVATDYCVEAAASWLLDHRCRVAIVVDAIRAIDAANEGNVLSDLVSRGALLTLTDVVCDE